MTPLADAACAGRTSLPASLWHASVEASPAVVAIFRLSTLQAIYLNPAARRRLDPGNVLDLQQLTLDRIIGVNFYLRLEKDILPQAQVLGSWVGICRLREALGSEFPAQVCFSTHAGEEPGAEHRLLCVQAVPEEIGSGTEDGAPGDRELLQNLLDAVADRVFFKDIYSRFLRVSRALAMEDGIGDPQSLIGLTDFDRFTVEHAQPAYDDEQRIIQTGEPVLDLEEKLTWPDGRVAWASTSKYALRDRNGGIVGTFGISRDITEQKRSEAERRDLEDRLHLAHRLESIGRLAAGVAHEINTPSQFITDNIHFLRESFTTIGATLARCGAEAKDEDTDYLLQEIPKTLEQSLEGLGRIARIVRSLKEFSHPVNSQRTSANLNQVIETAVTVCRHEWKYVATLAMELDSSLPPVSCVVDEFNQVILNLVVNAAHAIGAANRGPEGGRIVVRTRHDSQDAIIEVQDNGNGIPHEIQGKVFEPFFTTKGVGKGTGQGLTLVWNIVVKNHGGRVDFSSEPGTGTTFVVRLPLKI